MTGKQRAQRSRSAPQVPAVAEAAPEPQDDGIEVFPSPAAALPFLSEGVRQELVMNGRATDPMTGGTFVMNRETGQIGYMPRG